MVGGIALLLASSAVAALAIRHEARERELIDGLRHGGYVLYLRHARRLRGDREALSSESKLTDFLVPLGVLGSAFSACYRRPIAIEEMCVMSLVTDNSYRSLMPQMEERGFALVPIDAALGRAIDHSFALGHGFFTKPAEDKLRYALPAFVEGYRELGPEYSKVPERPDLTESFSVWNRNRARPELENWSAGCPLHGVLRDIFDQLTGVTRGLFRSMIDYWAPGAPELRFSNGSWLQVNYYEPARHRRELLQDPHEDMHLVTLVRANAPGLEIEVDGVFVPAEVGENELLVMPGSILSLMTGWRVKPLYHQVRNNHRGDPRSSILFFVNPEIDQVLEPWISNETNAGVDIVARASAGPSNFGLPTLVDGLAGKGTDPAEMDTAIRAPRPLGSAAQ